MKPPVLYSFRRCPYAIRVRMALAYSSISVELREVKLNAMPQQLLSLSPKATVPVLQVADGSILDESLDIMRWALSISDPEQWLSEDVDSRELIRQNDEDFKLSLDVYKYADRYPHKSQLEYRYDAENFLVLLENRLVESRYLNGDRLTITDIAIMPFIRQFAGVEPQWFAHCKYTATRRWLNQLFESDLFKTVMGKYAFWQPGDKPVYFSA